MLLVAAPAQLLERCPPRERRRAFVNEKSPQKSIKALARESVNARSSAVSGGLASKTHRLAEAEWKQTNPRASALSRGDQSSLTIVPTAWPSPRYAFGLGLARFRYKLSFASRVLSPITVTVSVRVETPTGKLSVPLIGR